MDPVPAILLKQNQHLSMSLSSRTSIRRPITSRKYLPLLVLDQMRQITPCRNVTTWSEWNTCLGTETLNFFQVGTERLPQSALTALVPPASQIWMAMERQKFIYATEFMQQKQACYLQPE